MRRLMGLMFITALGAAALWHYLQPIPVPVVVRAIERGLVEYTVANTRAGTIKACRRSKLSPQGGGTVDLLEVKVGDRVTAGQILLRLWNADLQAQLDLAGSELTASRARSEEACLTASFQQREVDRLQPLLNKGVISREQFDQSNTKYQTSRASCAASKAAAEVSVARVAVAQATFERTLLRAPFDGVVAEITGEVGEYVTPSPPGIITPAAVDLIDYSCIFVSAPIDEVDVPLIETGMLARVSLDAFPKQVFPGVVRRIAPYVLEVEKQARTVEIEVELDAKGDDMKKLLPGYSADIEVILALVESALRIPTEAVSETDTVMVLGEDGILQLREIKSGLRNWSYTQAVSGVAEGDQIVLTPDRPGVEAGALAEAE